MAQLRTIRPRSPEHGKDRGITSSANGAYSVARQADHAGCHLQRNRQLYQNISLAPLWDSIIIRNYTNSTGEGRKRSGSDLL
jgi:hypothetical protein